MQIPLLARTRQLGKGARAIPTGGARLARPRSLRVQLTLGSALLAAAAVLLVAITALVGLGLTFRAYQYTLIQNEAGNVASALAQGAAATGSLTHPHADVTGRHRIYTARNGGAQVWIMDAGGNLQSSPVAAPSDQAAYKQDAVSVTNALRRALAGQSEERTLPGSPFFSLSTRWYATQPVRVQNSAGQTVIIGAVALSTPPNSDLGSVFATSVAVIITVATIVVALLAAGVATLFSRSLTRPLSRLARASARIAQGDYSERIDISAPREIERVGASFNDMAAALERDVEELHRQEAARRELVANVSHELATPLTAIQGFTEALLDNVVTDPQQRTETIRTIEREAARLRRLVDQLREVARIEGGIDTLDRGKVALPTLVEATLSVVQPEAEREQVTVQQQLAPDLPPVYADEDRVTQMLLNLLDNALRVTPAGGVVTVAADVETSAERPFVRVSVADTGPGVPATDRTRVFERFYRGDPSRSAQTGGSGLGLAITRALVEAHGGSIRVESSSEHGAVFSFTLPVCR